MQKLLVLFLTVSLFLTGCQSPAWNTVVSVRPGDAFRQADPSSFYAEKLHAVLLEQGIEHYVVTYQYHYYTNHYEEAVGTRTAVVYCDNANTHYPWWLMDDRTATPFWLPDGDLDKQISFYCQRKAEVIEKKYYPAHGSSGKAMVAPKRAAQQGVQFRGSVAQRPPQPQLRAHVAERAQPVTKSVAANKTAAMKPVEKKAPSAVLAARLEKLFRFRNETAYDPTSAVDRRKMEQLKHGLVSQDTDGERGFRRGVDADPAF